MTTSKPLSQLIQIYFTSYLLDQRQARPNTIASYSDSFRLLLDFAHQQLKKLPAQLQLEDLEAPFILEFLRHLEEDRGNSPRTRNARLAAIHSFFRYISCQEPQCSDLIRRVLAIPTKRWEQTPIDFLAPDEVDALLAAPDLDTWGGRRDRALLALMVQTGLRVSETVGLRCQDVVLDKNNPQVHCQGKGRKQRAVPLTQEVAKILRDWLHERQVGPTDPLYPNARDKTLSRDGVAYLLKKHLKVAAQQCPSLVHKKVSPHVLRHTAAMNLHRHGIDRTVLALWLGHESIQSAQCYLHADLELKQRALEKTAHCELPPGRYKPPDKLLAFLEGLSRGPVMPSHVRQTAQDSTRLGGCLPG